MLSSLRHHDVICNQVYVMGLYILTVLFNWEVCDVFCPLVPCIILQQYNITVRLHISEDSCICTYTLSIPSNCGQLEYCSSKATKNNLISGFRQVAFLQPHQKSQVSYNYNEHIECHSALCGLRGQNISWFNSVYITECISLLIKLSIVARDWTKEAQNICIQWEMLLCMLFLSFYWQEQLRLNSNKKLVCEFVQMAWLWITTAFLMTSYW